MRHLRVARIKVKRKPGVESAWVLPAAYAAQLTPFRL